MSFEMGGILFEVEDYSAIELGRGDIPIVQTFLEDNPEYFLSAEGCPPTKTQAKEEFESELPEGWAFTNKRTIGFVDASKELTAFATIVSDLFADGVWHIGLLILSTDKHGQGVARCLYKGLESWLKASGARWLRLGVIAGNVRAERFWERNGYLETRRRYGVVMRNATHTMRVMIKPLGEAGIGEYLSLVSRDHPDVP
ncbi:GNAT family N-acetyltransferase [Paraburkholderia elongata]|uniref:GNAT family N-acetyltransferase n=1 Tax=Paraburkholderia elongata TaxID=2675747 RepID=A0A972SNH2_9BURK|nr:GNAT family N-acetyltransferase [Paraburkholderia elongata]NPT61242.1 GNAT family N-acetyltransferase [Paraburkholderia elongata]